MSDSLLMIFVKNLIPGMVKTRLAEDIGIDKALDVYQELIHHTHKITKKLEVDKSVYYSEYVEIEDIWDNGDFKLTSQKGFTLGEKMSNAFDEAFDSYNKVIIIGSDCYDLSSKHIKLAFEMLEENDVVVGPAKDGGYYLLGMSEFFPQLFQDKEYSTGKVLRELLEEAEELELSVYKLPELNDVDTLDDLKETNIDWTKLGADAEVDDEEDAY
ncbi:TIGR04282 family arsenosugar biosynthesis glycosyltransferase [Ekhidna sp.]|jgi:rSAM/selenodomain-associated transferase 1|uniref:TIGR04282 family arsenosugar biosynthesis glycosyltransferase n=1 Tax=Ekhidna sp. TaxID=2608089 RepID=UPI0032ECDABB